MTDKNTERRFFSGEDKLEIRASESGGSTIRGYFIRFGELSRNLGYWSPFREKFDKEAFDEVISADFRQLGNDTVCLFQHDMMWVLGRRSAGTLRIGTDDTGAWYECDLPDTQSGRDVMELIKRGDVRHNSFAFIVADGGDSWSEDDELGTIRTVKKVAFLKDVSPVTDPAYPQTDVEPAKRSFDAWQQEKEKENVTESWQAKALARDLYLREIETI